MQYHTPPDVIEGPIVSKPGYPFRGEYDSRLGGYRYELTVEGQPFRWVTLGSQMSLTTLLAIPQSALSQAPKLGKLSLLFFDDWITMLLGKVDLEVKRKQ